MLQQLIVTGLTHNYDLQLAATRIEQARALVGVAASPLYPQIGYQGVAGREKTFIPLEQNSGNITFNVFAGLFNVAWEIDVWGRIRRSTEAARATFFAQEDVRRGVMLTLVSDIATGYFRLLELDRELAIAQESSQNLQANPGSFYPTLSIRKRQQTAGRSRAGRLRFQYSERSEPKTGNRSTGKRT